MKFSLGGFKGGASLFEKRCPSLFRCRRYCGIFCAQNFARVHTTVQQNGCGGVRVKRENKMGGDTMEKKELGREDVIEALKEIAFGRVNRGVELTYLSEPTAQLIRKMDLSAVAEFKRNGNGTVEVKFVDRVKALSALYDMLGGGDADEAAEFLQALEQAGEEKDDWRA
uniref:Terminase small subunit n=1 Tax=Siphoviridae sp. ctjdk2 TaxID=2825635 RepID=A0A8S5UL15_9CAUD|nr:MAG TPA: Terminase small subunit [Siphoviridae sp. ctjdk2]